MLKEFRNFIARGNVIDLAVGIIIGAAFTAIVNSMVNDLINPIIGVVTGGTDFSAKYVVLSGTAPEYASLAAARAAGANVFAYGSFLSAVINFLIIAFVVFLLVKAVNEVKERALHRGPDADKPPMPPQEKLLLEIRDILASDRPVVGGPDARPDRPVEITSPAAPRA